MKRLDSSPRPAAARYLFAQYKLLTLVITRLIFSASLFHFLRGKAAHRTAQTEKEKKLGRQRLECPFGTRSFFFCFKVVATDIVRAMWGQWEGIESERDVMA